MRTLLPYLWPKGDPEIKARVAFALVCIGLAKAATVIMPPTL